MDLIFVMTDGAITEQGTHDELIKDKSSYYYKLFEYENI